MENMFSDEFSPLEGLRVLDLSDEKGELCGRILGDLGADVLKIEPSNGTVSRTLGPFAPDGTSLYFAYRNLNKRSASIDFDTTEGVDDLFALIKQSDVLIETFLPGTLAELGISPELLLSENPSLIIVSLTDFGQTGPDSSFVGTDEVVFARSGWLSVSGVIDKPPLLAPGSISYDTLGIVGAYATLLGILHRDRNGTGQHIDVSAVEALAQMNTWGIPNASASEISGGPATLIRSGDSPLYPHIPCADGFVRQVILAPRQWRALWEWMGSPESFADEYWESTINRYMNLDVINPLFWEHWQNKPMIEGCIEAQNRGVIATPMLKPSDVLANTHYKSRGTFQTLEITNGLTAPVMSGFAEVDGKRVGYRFPAPTVDQDDPEFSQTPFPFPTKSLTPADLPLEGLRVVDFGHGGVGVECGRMLAEYGADVIKIESWEYPDFIRIVLGGTMTASFASSNRTKRAFGANLKNEKAREVVLELIKDCHVVIENNSTGTMDALGLGYDAIKQINPNAVMISSQLMGSKGDFANWNGYGPTIQTVSGLSWLWAFKDGEPPPGTTAIHPDHLAGRLSAVFALAAIVNINRGASGNHIEVAQVEVLLGTLGDLFCKEAIQPDSVVPQGNDSDRGAPWGPFPCKDDESWCVICVRNDEEWKKLSTLMQLGPEITEKYLSSAYRVEHRETLNSIVSAWSVSLSSVEVEKICQNAGIPAGRVLNAAEQLSDEHLLARNFLPKVEQLGGVGEIILDGACIRGSKMASPVITRAPLIGEHTEEICRENLSMETEKFESLLASGALEIIKADS
ncbi:MAG: CoA transferase [Acidimicrobiales bacterium]|nr:CoA transferase [Acidimicrobiales bacterium]